MHIKLVIEVGNDGRIIPVGERTAPKVKIELDGEAGEMLAYFEKALNWSKQET